MRFPRWLLRAVLITAVLLIGSTAIGYSKAEDPYRSFDGMGSSVSVAPSDDKLTFTYITNGQEKIYTSTADGKNPEPLTDLDQPQFSPSFHPHSPDDILFLSEQNDSIRSLYTAETENSQHERLTGSELHVRDAAYSPDGTLIYFLGMPADAWKSADRSTEEGFSIYSMPAEGGAYKKITNESKYLMGNISPDATGNMLLYTYTEGPDDEMHVGMKTLNNKVYEEHIEFADSLPGGLYNPTASPSESRYAYTNNVASSQEPNYQYDLFLYDLEEMQAKRLTNHENNIDSPSFFHQSDDIAYMHQKNWPEEPAEYELRIVNSESGADEVVRVNMNQSGESLLTAGLGAAQKAVSVYVIGFFYTLFGSWFIIAAYKKYRPFLVGAASTTVTLGLWGFCHFGDASYPWLAAICSGLVVPLFICTGILFLFAGIQSYRLNIREYQASSQ